MRTLRTLLAAAELIYKVALVATCGLLAVYVLWAVSLYSDMSCPLDISRYASCTADLSSCGECYQRFHLVSNVARMWVYGLLAPTAIIVFARLTWLGLRAAFRRPVSGESSV